MDQKGRETVSQAKGLSTRISEHCRSNSKKVGAFAVLLAIRLLGKDFPSGVMARLGVRRRGGVDGEFDFLLSRSATKLLTR
jgi:hypothetical protein